MKHFISIFYLTCLLALTATAQVPQLINHQGYLTDSTGQGVTATLPMTFRFFADSTGGTASLTQSFSDIQVVKGVYTVVLDVSYSFTSEQWIETEVNSELLSPRTRITSVPYALHAFIADSLNGFLPNTALHITGGTMFGEITSMGSPSITMGKGNFGSDNVNTGTMAFVAGSNNRARGSYSVVSGGGGINASDSNSATGSRATIGGGYANKANGGSSTVGGGDNNTAGADRSTVGGGYGNFASGVLSTIAGGDLDTASGTYSTVGGGYSNTASGSSAMVGGGSSNTASGSSAMVGGGFSNTASGSYAMVGGGYSNTASSDYAMVGGGFNNTASSYAMVGGGSSNTASSNYAVVPGGRNNLAGGRYSFAAGRKAKANHDGTFVWADTTDADFSSNGVNQFLIRANGGVGIGTNTPSSMLGIKHNSSHGASPHILLTEDADDYARLDYKNTQTSNFWSLAGYPNATDASSSFNLYYGGTTTNNNMMMISGTGQTALYSGMNVDRINANTGSVNPGVTFGLGSGEGISSKRTTGGNQYGLDIYTSSVARMSITGSGNIGIGTTSPQGALDVSSTTGAFIVPRMTTTQRDALTAVNGMIIYNTTTNQFNFRENGAWVTK